MSESTNNQCSICCKKVRQESNLNPDVLERREICFQFFTLACRYLSLECHLLEPNKTLATKASDPAHSYRVCSDCCQLVESFCELYNEWQLLQVKVGQILDQIGNLMQTSTNAENDGDLTARRKPRSSNLLKSNVGGDFRRKFVQRILEERRHGFPRLMGRSSASLQDIVANKKTKTRGASATIKKEEDFSKNLGEGTDKYGSDYSAHDEPLSPTNVSFVEVELSPSKRITARTEPEHNPNVSKSITKEKNTLDQSQNLSTLSGTGGHADVKKKRKKKQRRTPHTCIFCHQVCQGVSNYVSHLLAHIGERPYSCSICQKGFATNRCAKIHERTHVWNEFLCRFCGKKFKNQTYCAHHEKVVHTNSAEFTCKYCGKQYLQKRDLAQHEAMHRGEPSNKCQICGKEYFRKSELTLHLKLHEGGGHKCGFCEKEFLRLSDKIYHEKIHKKHKPFTCTYCGKQFLRVASLRLHEKQHTGEKNYQCPYCVKRFTSRASLKEHERTHTGEKKYVCHYGCDKSFNTKFSLMSHEATHTGIPAPTPLVCKFCGKMLSSASGLTVHEKSHMGQGDKPFHCRRCGDSFEHLQLLKNHEMGHATTELNQTPTDQTDTNDIQPKQRSWSWRKVKPFKCEICCKHFVSNRGLKSHVRMHGDDADKPFQCGYCNKGFIRKDQLRKHSYTHTGEKPYSCAYCLKQFASSSNRRTHEKLHFGWQKNSDPDPSEQVNSVEATRSTDYNISCAIADNERSRENASATLTQLVEFIQAREGLGT